MKHVNFTTDVRRAMEKAQGERMKGILADWGKACVQMTATKKAAKEELRRTEKLIVLTESGEYVSAKHHKSNPEKADLDMRRWESAKSGLEKARRDLKRLKEKKPTFDHLPERNQIR